MPASASVFPAVCRKLLVLPLIICYYNDIKQDPGGIEPPLDSAFDSRTNNRVLGDSTIAPDTDIDLDFVASNLKKLSDYANDRNVIVLIETNGILANSNNMTHVLDKADSINTGVLWDIHHPYRFFHEPVEQTFITLKDRIKLVHVKDSVIENGKIKYKMTGYGDVPVEEALLLLKKNGYEGFISSEWIKRWCADL